jgi:biopolymer transport protein ExbD
VLVILLLLTSRLAFTAGIRTIELPAVGRDLTGVTNPILVVAVDADGKFYYENQEKTEEALFERLRSAVQQSKDALTLVIYADYRVQLYSFARLLAAPAELGFKDVVILTRRAGAPAKNSPTQRAVSK